MVSSARLTVEGLAVEELAVEELRGSGSSGVELLDVVGGVLELELLDVVVEMFVGPGARI